jgi:Fic family protein
VVSNLGLGRWAACKLFGCRACAGRSVVRRLEGVFTARLAVISCLCGDKMLLSPHNMRRKPQFIHEQPGWPSFHWDSGTLAAPLAAVRHKQGRLLGKMETLGFQEKAEASLATITADVVKSSAIEGEALNPDEVRSSIARRLGLDVGGLTKASRSVEGVVEMMLDATQNFDSELTADRLFGWHSALFPTGRSGMNRIAVSQWRPEGEPMQVVSGPMGKETVHFQAPQAGMLEDEMSKFLAWFNEPPAMDPVLKAGIAHFWFVTIHPFEDGNGRLARAIADMALARADGTKDRFYSMSSQIEVERKEYYQGLETAQRGDLDITRWLEWFLACLDHAIDGAETGLAGVLTKARIWDRVNQRPVNERQRTVINRMLNGFQGFLTTSKYAKLAKCSTDTALRDIQELLDRGIIVKNPGRGRSTSYRLAEAENIVA